LVGLNCDMFVHPDEVDVVVSTEDFRLVDSSVFGLVLRLLNFPVFKKDRVEEKEACIASGKEFFFFEDAFHQARRKTRAES
jgi:hypothetical protein